MVKAREVRTTRLRNETTIDRAENGIRGQPANLKYRFVRTGTKTPGVSARLAGIDESDSLQNEAKQKM
jgi:hypothetical protein